MTNFHCEVNKNERNYKEDASGVESRLRHKVKGLETTLFVCCTLVVLSCLLEGCQPNKSPKSIKERKEIRLPRLQRPAEVLVDNWGISHVFAKSDEDLFFLQGYTTAADRLFHMDFNRRQASGRLAEIFGKDLLKEDRYMRTVGLARVGKKALEQLTTRTRAAIEAYVQGVNAYIEEHRKELPLEFRIFGYEPGTWTSLDSVICWKWFAWNLTQSWRSDAALGQIIEKVGEAKAKEVFPFYLEDAPTIVNKGELSFAPQLSGLLPSNLGRIREGNLSINADVGSNGWCVAGTKTVTGKPLLASNSHLEMTVPSVYYEIHLSGGDYDVTGVSIPGTPGIFLGHNRTIGWQSRATQLMTWTYLSKD